VDTAEAVAGKKHIMIYFSAHWCPPCRGFTPQLAKAYKESSAAGTDTMVVFVSSDRDQQSFEEYYGEQPWHALPFADRDRKQKLSEAFSVKGIPTLIVLDDQGKVVTQNGRADYMNYLPAGGVVPAEGPSAEILALLGEKLVSKEGEIATAEALAAAKHVMIYFSAHWCPPCRGFTPQLAKAYTDSPVAGKDTMVIFVSADQSKAQFDEYYGEMPWHAIPYDDQETKQKLNGKFDVQGIPFLVVLNATGGDLVATKNGRAEYSAYLNGTAPGAGKGGNCGCVIS